MFCGDSFYSTRKGGTARADTYITLCPHTGSNRVSPRDFPTERSTRPRARRPPRFFDIICKFGLICFVLVASPANATQFLETHSINLPDRRFHGELRVVFHSELHPACGRTARARVLHRALPIA